MRMNMGRIRHHVIRAWQKHWGLQMASVTVMTVVLLILNLMFLGGSVFSELVGQWGRGLEMIVYVKDGVSQAALDQLTEKIKSSGKFESVQFNSKNSATKKFLASLGSDSLELLSDPQWKSPIPANFELRLSQAIPVTKRLATLKNWSSQFKTSAAVEDVSYGQGWIENFSRFMSSARGFVAMIWILSLSVGLLIVSNCIQLSFSQRRSEIEVLELVGATPRFIRTPFLVEGVVLGILAAVLSLLGSYGLHAFLLSWMSHNWTFWISIHEVPILTPLHAFITLVTGVAFGALGSWNCVRKLNTGWSAAG